MQQHMRAATEAELVDLETMLKQRGIAPVSDSVMRWGQARVGRVSGGGLWSIVNSFRADKNAKDAGDVSKGSSKKSRAHTATAFTLTASLLKEHGYPEDHIRDALTACGPDVRRCVDYCLQMRLGPASDEPCSASSDEKCARANAPRSEKAVEPITEEEWASTSKADPRS